MSGRVENADARVRRGEERVQETQDSDIRNMVVDMGNSGPVG